MNKKTIWSWKKYSQNLTLIEKKGNRQFEWFKQLKCAVITPSKFESKSCQVSLWDKIFCNYFQNIFLSRLDLAVVIFFALIQTKWSWSFLKFQCCLFLTGCVKNIICQQNHIFFSTAWLWYLLLNVGNILTNVVFFLINFKLITYSLIVLKLSNVLNFSFSIKIPFDSLWPICNFLHI